MFFSRMTLSPAAESDPDGPFWRVAADPYRLHQEVWRLVGGGPGAERDFVYRAESSGRRPTLYALGPRPASDPDGLWITESKAWHPALAEKDELAFRLRANATVRLGSTRHDVVIHARQKLREQGVPADEQPPRRELEQRAGRAWLVERAEGHGFEVIDLVVEGHHLVDMPRRGRRIRIATLEYSGRLRVLDVERFGATLARGIGPSKAFGCGLLLVRRPS